jgi:hypothetical protein
VASTVTPQGLVGHLSGATQPASYTEEEQRNMETVIALRRASFAERKAFHAPDFTVHRRGMAHLAARADASGGSGYDGGSIPDRSDEIVDIIAKGDRVWCVWRIRGTHRGPLFGVEPTGASLDVLEVGAWRFVDGLVAEAWFFADELALAHQLASR